MPTRIVKIKLIFQKPIDPEEYGIDPDMLESTKAFPTQGQDEKTAIVRIGKGLAAENTLFVAEADIPVGIAGVSSMVKRFVLRMVREHVNEDPDWRFFYAIAEFAAPDGTSYFRTIIPRTEITVRFRSL